MQLHMTACHPHSGLPVKPSPQHFILSPSIELLRETERGKTTSNPTTRHIIPENIHSKGKLKPPTFFESFHREKKNPFTDMAYNPQKSCCNL